MSELTLDDLLNAKRLMSSQTIVRKEAPVMLSGSEAKFLQEELGGDWVRKAEVKFKGLHPTGFFTDIVIYVDNERVSRRSLQGG